MKNLPVNFQFNKLLFQSIAFVIMEKGLNRTFIFSHLLKLIPPRRQSTLASDLCENSEIRFQFVINRPFSQFLKKNDFKT